MMCRNTGAGQGNTEGSGDGVPCGRTVSQVIDGVLVKDEPEKIDNIIRTLMREAMLLISHLIMMLMRYQSMEQKKYRNLDKG